MMPFLARPIAKWLIVGVIAAVLAGAAVYLTGALRQAGRDAERADQNAKTIQIQEKINDADARGPRTPDAVDRRLRDGNF